ncbi:GGDEF domain-containing protein [Isoalcanivorax indicus]|uniref:GGDEF domain-containing protein n=1 Tax=Isoalcanivorax indicus TaxID=2202653 RepID=UPI000DB92CB7|nr:GGDEF domain-containing protein [Isoalcanivorax indicus]
MGFWNQPLDKDPLQDNEPDVTSHDRLRGISRAAQLTLLVLLVSVTVTAISILATGERNWVFAMGLSVLIPLLIMPAVIYPVSCINASLQRHNQHLRQLARHDHLTGLYNRPYMLNMLERELALSSRHDYAVSVILIDLQNNRDIIDHFGRHASDKAMQMLAREVRAQIRESDLFGRFEGAQFILVLPHTSLRDALRISNNLRERLAQQQVQGNDLSITLRACCGVASTETSSRALQSLLNDADYALYSARNHHDT